VGDGEALAGTWEAGTTSSFGDFVASLREPAILDAAGAVHVRRGGLVQLLAGARVRFDRGAGVTGWCPRRASAARSTAADGGGRIGCRGRWCSARLLRRLPSTRPSRSFHALFFQPGRGSSGLTQPDPLFPVLLVRDVAARGVSIILAAVVALWLADVDLRSAPAEG
jgi:hypothetical protein